MANLALLYLGLTLESRKLVLAMKKTVLFTLVIWVSLLLVAETGVRLLDALAARKKKSVATINLAPLFEPHPFMAYAANPLIEEHNDQGFRAPPETFYEEETDALRIVCLGGSSTYGTRVRLEDSYPYRLQVELDERALDAEVINAGLGGYSTPNLISLVALRIAPLRPKIALFYIGFNDAWNRVLFPGLRSDYSHAMKSWDMSPKPAWEYSRLALKIATLFGHVPADARHVHSIAWHPTRGYPADNWSNSTAEPFTDNLVTLVSIARGHGITPVLILQATDFESHSLPADNNLWKTAMESYRDVIRQVAERESVQLIDLDGRMSNRAEYFEDVLHMSALGNAERARLIADHLMETGLLPMGPASTSGAEN